MFRTLAVRGTLALVLLLSSAAAAQVTTWDASRDFSGTQNPNGQWTYGWKGFASVSLNPFPIYQETLVAYPGRDAWQDFSQSNLLGVYHNTLGVTGDIPTNMLLLQPDPLGELAIVEWTAPANMSLQLQGTFLSLDTNPSDVSVSSSVTGTLFSARVNNTTATSSFGRLLNVTAGEKIDFIASGGAAGLNVVINKLSILGNATIQNIAPPDTRIRLTSNAAFQVGGAWIVSKQRVGDGFETSFLFQISQLTSGGADGFAFVIQNSSPTAIGGSGGSLGYDGIPASLAVEFDTFQNTETGWNDPNGNHISVHSLGVNPNSAKESASLASSTLIPNLKDGRWHLVRLQYLVQPQPHLLIYVDDLNAPVLQVSVDIISKLQLTEGTAWVGLTGGTGGFTEVHDIQSWYFHPYDLHSPELSLPVNMTLEGNTLGGATAAFATSALDAVDGSLPVTCTPTTGAVFPLGSTTVTCSSTDLTGNTATGHFVITVLDTTPPDVVVPLTVNAPAVDHVGASVSYIATAHDIVGGDLVPACSPVSGNTFPLGKTVVTCRATDGAGNSTSQEFLISVTDQAPPVISGGSDLQREATGKFTNVSWAGLSAIDNVDGSVAVLCAPASGSQFAVGSATVQCSAADAAGNRASSSFVVTVVDTTAPAISGLPANLILEATGPSGANVTWPSATATDLVDGVVPVTCSPVSGTIFPIGKTTVVCSAADAHGNQSTKGFIVTVQNTDAAPPVVSCGRADRIWHVADVAIACTATDIGSGLANASDASFVLFTSVPLGIETANATTNSKQVCDLLGNCVTSGPIPGNAIDKRSPTISIINPTNATYSLHQPVAASYSCVDGGSGVAMCNGPVANGAPLDTASTGAKQFTVNASDIVGNLASSSVTYSVGYNLCLLGRAEPKQAGSTIPVRLELCDYAGNNVSSPALQVVAAALLSEGGAAMPINAAGDANPGMRFRYIGAPTGGAYIFNLQTTGLAPGTYQLLVRVSGDSTAHAITFRVQSKERSR